MEPSDSRSFYNYKGIKFGQGLLNFKEVWIFEDTTNNFIL